MQLETGVVVFPADDTPFETKYGKKFSVKVEVNGQVPRSVYTDDQGRVSLWARADDPETGQRADAETAYLRSLQKGDQVQLVLNKKGSGYNLVVPTGMIASPPAQQAQARPVQSQPQRAVDGGVAYRAPDGAIQHVEQVWYPLSDEEREAFLHIAGTMMDTAIVLMSEAQVKLAQASFGEVTDLRVLQALAATGYIQAGREYRRGMVVHKPAELDEAEATFLAGIDETSEETLVASVLDGIAGVVGAKRNEVAELLKSFGLTRAELTGGQESQLFLLNVARTYYQAAQTESQAECRRLIEEKFGLKDAQLF